MAPVVKAPPPPPTLRSWLTDCHPVLGDTVEALAGLGLDDLACLLALTRSDWLAVLASEPLPTLTPFQRALLKSRVPKFLSE